MARQPWLAALAVFVLVAFGGLAGGAGPAGAQTAKGENTHEEKLTPADLPPDVKLVIWGILLRLHDQPVEPSDGIVFDPVSYSLLAGSAEALAGLGVAKTTIANYMPVLGQTPHMALDGTFAFGNAAGRRVAMFFSADYTLGEDAVLVGHASVVPLYAPEPQPSLFVVPAARAPDGFKGVSDSFDAFYAFAAAQALRVNAGEAPAAEMAPYYLVLAFPDRLPLSAKVSMTLSPQPEGRRTPDAYEFLGWRIYVMRANLALGTVQPTVNVTVTSAVASPNQTPIERTVAVFNLPKAKK